MRIILGLLLANILWASAFVGIRDALHSFSPGSLALFRYLLASICMGIIYSRLPKRQWPSLREWPFIVFLGVIGIAGYNIGLNYGELTVSASTASFVISQMPIIMAVLAIIFLGERITPATLVGLILGLVGVSVIAYSGMHEIDFESGLLFVVLAAIGASIYSTMQKPLLTKYSAIELTSYLIWSATAGLLFYTPDLVHELPKASPQAIAATVYLGIFPAAIAYAFWAHAIANLKVTQVASSLYLIPIIATFLGWLLLHEIPSAMNLLGCMIALSGAIVVTSFNARTKSRARRDQSEPRTA